MQSGAPIATLEMFVRRQCLTNHLSLQEWIYKYLPEMQPRGADLQLWTEQALRPRLHSSMVSRL